MDPSALWLRMFEVLSLVSQYRYKASFKRSIFSIQPKKKKIGHGKSAAEICRLKPLNSVNRFCVDYSLKYSILKCCSDQSGRYPFLKDARAIVFDAPTSSFKTKYCISQHTGYSRNKETVDLSLIPLICSFSILTILDAFAMNSKGISSANKKTQNKDFQ